MGSAADIFTRGLVLLTGTDRKDDRRFDVRSVVFRKAFPGGELLEGKQRQEGCGEA